ncbi:MAG: signal recognition particle-docking protein FtsY [Clostridia bacterium]|jgi:signal recognition particle-docking protein ftsY|nr:signal recognition particle-docking protein FtsY [Clostridia bacterium]
MGLFGKLKEVLRKTKESLSKKLVELFAKNKLGDEFYEELEDILISSDVSVKTAMNIVENIRDVAIEEKCKDKDYVVKLLKDELYDTLTEAEEVQITSPAVIMMVGVNGVGKTTTIGKLANYFVSQGKSVTIAAADTFRAAASDQLTVWAERAKVRIVKHAEGADPSAVVYDAIASVKAKKTDVLIIDTAGRLHVKANLMEELKKMDRVVTREYPEANFYKLIALDATTGQNAYNQVDVFKEAIGLDGIVLTKLDGTAKGGFVISLCGELQVPVVYVGTGEKIDDIELFNANDFVEGLF